MLKEIWPHYEIISFALNVKKVVALLTGTTLEQNLTREGKASIPPGFNKTLGEYQQIVGQGMRDIVQHDVWVQGVLWSEALFKIIPDVRYPGEVQAIEAAGGIVIRLFRPQELISVNDAQDPSHSSEIALNNHKFDYVVINDGSLEELKERALEAIAKFMATRG